MAAIIYEVLHTTLKKPIFRLAAEDSIIPCAKNLEDEVLLTTIKLEHAITEILA
jgi:pyruvate/2-oxoglutarate/acetoin dehydrogenase E1 component